MIGEKIPLHVSSRTGKIDELCYIDVEKVRYKITHIHNTFMLLERIGTKHVFLLVNTALEHEFSFQELMENRDVPSIMLDLKLQRSVTYFDVLNAIYEHYYEVVV